MDTRSSLKKLPSVERLLEDERISSRINLLSRGGITCIVREKVAGYRERMLKGEFADKDEKELREAVSVDVVRELDLLSTARLRRVINATGVILHTNLGRAVLGDEARQAIDEAASGYVDLEIDLGSGARVDRGSRVARMLSVIMGVEDALVVNNNAAAVLLAVRTFAGDGGVAVSRGELVEIGGSFRLPEILTIAASRVIEVGTTNRTHLKDYERAIRDGATLLLKVHTSNYRIVGYTNEVTLKELVDLGRKHGVPVMYDQGSGVLYPLHMDGVDGEECISDLMDSGVDIISFSADKVLGATQGGVLAGASALIQKMRSNHLSRALRVDKLTLAGLERVLLHYWNGEVDRIPTIKMITVKPEFILARAERFAASLRGIIKREVEVNVVNGESSIGGGSFPVNPLRSVLVEVILAPGLPEKLSETLRGGEPAVLVRVKHNSVYIDLRSVAENEERVLLERMGDGLENIFGRE